MAGRTRRGQSLEVGVRVLRKEVERCSSVGISVEEAAGQTLGAQKYVAALVRADCHDVHAITTIPELHGRPAFSERGWIHVQLMQIVRDLNVPWLLEMQNRCTPQNESCASMRLQTDVYLCPIHGDGRSCSALEYAQHALDGVAKQLASPKAFPPQHPIPNGSVRLFGSSCKQIARLFLHVYYQHPAMFAQCEAKSALYARFRRICELYSLYPIDGLPISP